MPVPRQLRDVNEIAHRGVEEWWRRDGSVFFASLAIPLALVMVFEGGGVGGATGSSGQDPSSSGQSPPAFVQRTLRAIPLRGTPPSSTPNLHRVGVLVPKVDILATTADSNQVRFGLAVYRDLMWATYPAISTDGGAIWRIGGPRFYVAAAQAASVTSSVGTLGSRGAYFWGQGGDVVDVTTNEGARWWTTGFAAGVYKVSDTRGTLRTVALGNQVKGGAFQAFLYLSTNSGRTWHLRGQLHNVMP